MVMDEKFSIVTDYYDHNRLKIQWLVKGRVDIE